MVLIDGVQMQIYDLDDKNSIKQRVASIKNTLPKYLYFPNELDIENEVDINMENILDYVKGKSSFNFADIYNPIQHMLNGNGLNIEKDIIYIWVAYNEELENIPTEFRSSIFLEMDASIQELNTIPQQVNTSRVYNERDEIRTQLENDIEKNKRNVRSMIELFESFTMPNSVIHTDFELEKIAFTITFNNLHNVSLYDMFNYTELTKEVPFCTIDNYFKIYNEFIPNNDWNVSIPESIVYRVLQTKGDDNISVNYDAYSNVFLNIQNGVLSASFELEINHNNLDIHQFIERFLNVFQNNKIDTKFEIKEDNIDGVFYIPNQNMERHVFSDMVMNNRLFSIMLSIDERLKTTKKKTGLFVIFNSNKHKNIRFTVTERYRTVTDTVIKDKSILEFPIGNPYIRFKISKAPSMVAIQHFQKMISQLFSIYNNEYQSIVEEYRQYIPNFATERKEIEQKEMKLKDIVPELFKGGVYARTCEKIPRIVSREEAERIGEYILFPKTPEEGAQYYYVCDQYDGRYPGIRPNQYRKGKLKYVPCCYTKNQKTDPKSRYYEYYEDNDYIYEVQQEQQRIITTNKILKFDIYGILPGNVNYMFEILDNSPSKHFYRRGVNRSTSSFLECILNALNVKSNVMNERKRLAEVAGSTGICRQELYDKSPNQIRDMLLDMKVYMDPNLFINLIQHEYQCNVYIFSTLNGSDGELSLPRFLQVYLKQKNTLPNIFILEHMGSEADKAEYPQCELIVMWNNVDNRDYDNVQNVFRYDNPISKGVYDMFQKTSESYIGNNMIQSVHLPFGTSDIEIVSQYIDSYGKCRMLNVSHMNTLISVFTSPVVPLAVPETTLDKIHTANSSVIQSIFDTLQIRNMNDTQNNIVTGILGNVNVFVYSTQQYSTSIMNIYNQNKNIAKYMTEFLLWLFSTYIHQNNIQDIDNSIIENFVYQNVEIDPNYTYSNITKTFSYEHGLIRNRKLIVHDNDTVQRLIYVLKLNLERQADIVFNYHTKSSITNYYNDISDFDYHAHQVILYGDDSIEKWIYDRQHMYHIIKDGVDLTSKAPYFFRNILVSARIYLAQNMDTLEKALEVGKIWSERGLNVRNDYAFDSTQISGLGYTLYVYESVNNIEIYQVGEPNEYDIQILGYKYNNVPLYTVLLKI